MDKMQLIGPSSAGIGKVKDIYRFVFYIKDKDYNNLIQMKDALEQMLQRMDLKGIHIQFDFDPMNTL